MKWILWIIMLLPIANIYAAGHSLHIQMSKKAVGLVSDSKLKQLLNDNKSKWVIGSCLPDGGYAKGYAYSEEAHWPTFHRSYFNHIKSKCPASKLEDADCQGLVAHFMGMAAHGIEDEVYDALLFSYSDKMDGQEDPSRLNAKDTLVDKYTIWDFKYAYDVMPTAVSPTEDVYQALVPLLGKDEVQIDHIEVGQEIMIAAGSLERQTVNVFTEYADRKKYPWLRANYQSAPGGLNYSAATVAKLWNYYWNKFNDKTDIPADVTIYPKDNGKVGLDRSVGRGQFYLISDHPLHNYTIYDDTFFVEELKDDGSWQRISTTHTFDRRGYICGLKPSRKLTEGRQYRATLTTGVKDRDNNSLVKQNLVWTVTASTIK